MLVSDSLARLFPSTSKTFKHCSLQAAPPANLPHHHVLKPQRVFRKAGYGPRAWRVVRAGRASRHPRPASRGRGARPPGARVRESGVARRGPDPGGLVAARPNFIWPLRRAAHRRARLPDTAPRRTQPALASHHRRPVTFTGAGLGSYAALVDEARGGRGGGGGAGAPGVAQEHGGLPQTPDSAFARLLTLDLSRCPGVRARTILDLLLKLRIHESPKADRLHRLALAGCAVNKAGAKLLITSTRTQIGIDLNVLPSGLVSSCYTRARSKAWCLISTRGRTLERQRKKGKKLPCV